MPTVPLRISRNGGQGLIEGNFPRDQKPNGSSLWIRSFLSLWGFWSQLASWPSVVVGAPKSVVKGKRKQISTMWTEQAPKKVSIHRQEVYEAIEWRQER
jgi:hypothetical protein